MDGVAFHDPMHEATKKPLTTVAACHCSPYSPGRQSRPHLFHVVRKVCTKSGHVSTIPSAVKNNSHHGISTIKSDYPLFVAAARTGVIAPHTGFISAYRPIRHEQGLKRKDTVDHLVERVT